MAKAKFASVFLSHSWKDKPLVEAVLEALGRRGIGSWIDNKELSPGMGLRENIFSAIRENVSVVAFLSPNALAEDSYWVKEELQVALNREMPEDHWLIPVYMGNPYKLVNMCSALEHWSVSKGKRVDKLGICVEEYDSSSLAAVAEKIAEGVTRSVLKSQLNIGNARELVVVLDQRGRGQRTGEYALSDLENVEAPVLVFRPSSGTKSPDKLLSGSAWIEFRDNIGSSLDIGAVGDRQCTVRILGQAQLGVAYFLGHYFRHGSRTTLCCYNSVRPGIDSPQIGPDGRPKELIEFSNASHPQTGLLEGGNPYCYRRELLEGETSSDYLKKGDLCPRVALWIGKRQYVGTVRAYMNANDEREPLLSIDMPDFIDSKQVMTFIADVVACVRQLADQNQTHVLRLYTGLPFNVIPLLASNLSPHVGVSVEFMEWCQTAKDPKDKYVMLPMD